MSRTSREVVVGCPHHITQRGNNRQQSFFDEQDHITYLNLLFRYTQKYDVEVWAYCLMSNHIHILAIPHEEKSFALGIGVTNMTYTQYVNRKYRRVGRFWQNRYFSSVVENENYLWAVARYVENNPVVAGLSTCAEEFKWSSAKYHLSQQPDRLLDQSSWLSPQERKSYKTFLGKHDRQTTELISQAISSEQPIC
jgi:putative transposase